MKTQGRTTEKKAEKRKSAAETSATIRESAAATSATETTEWKSTAATSTGPGARKNSSQNSRATRKISRDSREVFGTSWEVFGKSRQILGKSRQVLGIAGQETRGSDNSSMARGQSRRFDNLGLREWRRFVQGRIDRHRLHNSWKIRLRGSRRFPTRVQLRDGNKVRRGAAGGRSGKRIRRLHGKQARSSEWKDHRSVEHGQEANSTPAAYL